MRRDKTTTSQSAQPQQQTGQARAAPAADPFGNRLERVFFARDPLEVAPDLLGRILVHATDAGTVAVRLTEVEAYAGRDDPASHAFRGATPRTAVMFGPPGFLYVYFVYGMHWCANLVTGDDGEASAVLLRAGEVVGGLPLAMARRPAARTSHQPARGPAALTKVLAISGVDSGSDLCATESAIRLHAGPGSAPRPSARRVATGPRVGVIAAAERPWRFWLPSEPSVSAYRPGTPRRRTRKENSVRTEPKHLDAPPSRPPPSASG